MSKTKVGAVDFPALARELGISRRQREDVLTAGLVTPVRRGGPGRGTQITTEDAERLRKATAIAALTGVAFLIILRLLASGAVIPNVP